jgi:hypothetical protein
MRKNLIHNKKEQRRQDHHNKHQDGGGDGFLARWPHNLGNLGFHVAHELGGRNARSLGLIVERKCHGGYFRHQNMAGAEGFEPTAPGFGDRCSTVELRSCRVRLQGRGRQVTGTPTKRKRGIQTPAFCHPSTENGAGDGNRTHTASLEGWNSTVELHPRLFCG